MLVLFHLQLLQIHGSDILASQSHATHVLLQEVVQQVTSGAGLAPRDDHYDVTAAVEPVHGCQQQQGCLSCAGWTADKQAGWSRVQLVHLLSGQSDVRASVV